MRSGALLDEAASDIFQFCGSTATHWQILGLELESRFGDALIGDVMNWICSGERDVATVQALSFMAESIDYYQQADYAKALEKLLQSRPFFPAHSPLDNLALTTHAAMLFALNHLSAASELLSKAKDENGELTAFKASYPFLAARNRSIMGSIELRSTDNEAAINHFNSGIEALALGGDIALKTRLMSLVAESHARAFQFDRAWQSGLGALVELRRNGGTSSAFGRACGFMAEIAEANGSTSLQLLYADCLVRHLAEEDGPSILATAYLALARAQVASGQSATKSLSTTMLLIKNHGLGRELQAHYHFVSGLNLVTTAPSQAMESLAQAEASFSEQQNQEYRILSATAGIGLNSDDQMPGSDQKLSNLVEMTTQALGNTRGSEFSLSVQQRFRSVYENKVRSLLRTNDVRGAMLLLQQSRRIEIEDDSYLDRIASTHTSGEATLVIASLGSTVAGWLVDQDGIQASFHAPIEKELQFAAIATSSNFARPEYERKQALSLLFETLIAPVANDIFQYEHLKIVPDGMFFGVPFPLLWDKTTQRFLVEDFSLSIAPELAFASQTGNIQRPYGSVALFDAAGADENRPLQFATQETTAIEQILRGKYKVRLFDAQLATRTNFLESMAWADILHYAGHGEANLAQPGQSRLIFGPAPSDVLTANDLDALSGLQMPELVTLAACDTAAYSDRLPNALSMVRPLLARGVREVVASLRPISDRMYTRFMQDFYAALVETEDAEEALRQTQVKWVTAVDVGRPLEWGFVQLYEYY